MLKKPYLWSELNISLWIRLKLQISEFANKENNQKLKEPKQN